MAFLCDRDVIFLSGYLLPVSVQGQDGWEEQRDLVVASLFMTGELELDDL